MPCRVYFRHPYYNTTVCRCQQLFSSFFKK
nr:MAG TPA: hypothetical protein [Caudoviricetes sp.]